MTYDVPRVGIGLFIIRNQRDILLGRRKNAHGEGEWAFPGGKQELNETVFETANRELMEECGPALKVAGHRILCVGDMTSYPGKHFLDVGIACTYVAGEPVVMEEDKCYEWKWFSMYQLPSPLFVSVSDYVEAHLWGKNYWNDRNLIASGNSKPSGLKDESECPRSHSDNEQYPCHVCKADV
jgi:8-oxo-dGTP diphosphatase